jgi:hypothetical protein
MVLGVLTLLGPLSATGHAQFPPGGFNPALGGAAAMQRAAFLNASLNPYVHPFAAQAAFNAATIGRVFQARGILATAGLSHPLAALSGAGFGYNLGMRNGVLAGMNSGSGWGPSYGQLGYGNLMNGGGFGGGYGGGLGSNLLNSAVGGAGYGYGMGMSMTQWMQNPYEGYLQGAASLTRADADYKVGIQQARLQREDSRRSALQTRRAMIEEAEWEREHMPDPEKIRQRELQREISIARSSPPLTDIWSARSLNALLGHLIARQGEGATGPSVPLTEETLTHINLTTGDVRGSVGLLKDFKDGGNLEWPEALLKEPFKENRESLNSLMKTAYKSAANGNNPTDATLNDLQVNHRKLQALLGENAARLSSDQYLEANRYLRTIGDTITALKDPNVANYFNGNWATKSKDVAQLVKFMRDKGLQFAPSTPKDEAAYMALYNALAAFDAGVPRVASRSRSVPEDK